MWTSKNRARYDRSKLRYPSDLTEEEWRLVEPLIPPGKTGGGKRTVIMREVVNGLHVHPLDRLSVARDPEKTCRRKARSTTTSICGPMTARWNGSTTLLYLSSVANRRSGKLVRPPPSSDSQTREKRRKKGRRALIRTGSMRGKKIKGKKRHILVDTLGLLLHAICSSGFDIQRSRWRRSCHGDLVRDVSLFEDALRRRRISRTALCESACKSFAASRH